MQNKACQKEKIVLGAAMFLLDICGIFDADGLVDDGLVDPSFFNIVFSGFCAIRYIKYSIQKRRNKTYINL